MLSDSTLLLFFVSIYAQILNKELKYLNLVIKLGVKFQIKLINSKVRRKVLHVENDFKTVKKYIVQHLK